MNFFLVVKILILVLLISNAVHSAQDIELLEQMKLDSQIKSMELTPDKNFLFTGNESGYIHKRDSKTLKSIIKEPSHSEIVNDIKIFDVKYVISTSSDGRIVIRDFDLNYISEKFLSKAIYSIDIALDGKYIISAGVDKKICLFQFNNFDNCLNTIDAHTNSINDVRFCDKSKKIISVSDDKQIKLFNKSKSKAEKNIVTTSPLKNICFHPNREIFSCGTEDGKILIVDLNSFQVIKKFDVGNPVTDMQFTDQGIYLFVSTANGYITIIDFKNNKIIYYFKAHNKKINDIVLSNETNYLYTASDDKYLKKWDISSYNIKNMISNLVAQLENKLAKISKNLSDDLSKLKKEMKKNEFETKSDYQQRLKRIAENKEKVKREGQQQINEFKQVIDERIKDLTQIPIPINDIHCELGKYNAEKEFFSGIVENDTFHLQVPRNSAKSFKLQFKAIDCSGIFSYTTEMKKKFYLLKFVTPAGKIYKIHPHNYAEDTGLPPQIVYETKFEDENQNNLLEVDEKAKIIITLNNNGKGSARRLKAILIPDKRYKFLNFTPEQNITLLNPNNEKEIVFNISADEDTPSDSCNFTIKFSEENGFEPISQKISFQTLKFEEPNISFEHTITDLDKNKIIESSEIIKVITRIINTGGTVFDLKGKLLKDENVTLTTNSNDNFQINDIAKNTYKDVEFSFYVNNKVSKTIPLSLKLQGKNFTEIYDYKFKLDEDESNIGSFIVTGETIKSGDIESLISDVDKDIPVTKMKNEDAIAVIIGNRNYKSKDICSVDFAIEDAKSVKKYLISAFGYQEENIIFKTDIDKTQFETIFGDKNDFKGRLYDSVRPEKSDVFIYYSGHGLPNVNDKTGYLASTYCDIKEIPLSCYSLQTLYDNLSKIPFKSMIVVIDACFSGNSPSGQLIKDASPVAITIDQPVYTKDNYMIMNSCSSDQIASWYRKQHHSLFTYLFLKGIQGYADANQDNTLTTNELKKYLLDETEFQAKKIWGRDQNPNIKFDKNKVLMNY